MPLRAPALCLVLLAATGCATSVAASGTTRRALIVGIDGLRPDALEAASAPRLHALLPSCARTLRGETQHTHPTISGPGWASVLTGVEPSRHGVVDNETVGGRSTAYPTFLARARSAGLSAALFGQWIGLWLMVEPTALPRPYAGLHDRMADAIAEAEVALRERRHDLYFVDFDDADRAGHAHGFSPEDRDYLAAIEAIDVEVGRLLTAIDAAPARASERWLVVLVSDHGGVGTVHTDRSLPANRTIPIAFCGDGVVPGVIDGATQLDVAPTVLRFLGVPF